MKKSPNFVRSSHIDNSKMAAKSYAGVYFTPSRLERGKVNGSSLTCSLCSRQRSRSVHRLIQHGSDKSIDIPRRAADETRVESRCRRSSSRRDGTARFSWNLQCATSRAVELEILGVHVSPPGGHSSRGKVRRSFYFPLSSHNVIQHSKASIIP